LAGITGADDDDNVGGCGANVDSGEEGETDDKFCGADAVAAAKDGEQEDEDDDNGGTTPTLASMEQEIEDDDIKGGRSSSEFIRDPASLLIL